MRFALAAVLLVVGFLPAAAAPTTPDAFIAAIKSAIAAKSSDQLLALTYTKGMSEADKKQTASTYQMSLFAHPVTAVSLGRLPDDFQMFDIANGKKFDSTAPPQGAVQIQQDMPPTDTSDIVGMTVIGYTIINGSYYLDGSKTTDLGWKGPPDKSLLFTVMGQGTSGIKVDVRWNTSGVEQEHTFTEGSYGFMGQYFDSVTVTCADPNANLSLELMEDGKDITEPLKGKGTITYSSGRS